MLLPYYKNIFIDIYKNIFIYFLFLALIKWPFHLFLIFFAIFFERKFIYK